MKKFIIKSFCLFVPLLLFLVWMEYNLGKVMNRYNYKRASLEQQADSIEVLVVGSSQPTFGVNPDYFCLKGFNLSNISQTLFYDSRLTLKYIDQMPKLKYVVINISYFTFGSQLYDGIESWRDYYYSQFWDIDYPELETFDVKKYSRIFLYTPATSVSYLLKGFDVNLVGNLRRNGFYWVDTTSHNPSINDSTGRNRVRLHDAHFHDSRFEGNVNDLDQLIGNLRKRGITPILVTPPVLPTYSRYVNPDRMAKNKKAIDQICSKHHCKYLDYFTDSTFRRSDFADNDHLNFMGAEKFSKLLNRDALGCTADSTKINPGSIH